MPFSLHARPMPADTLFARCYCSRDRTWAECSCVTLRLQPPTGAVEVYNFLESAGCGDRFEAFHDFGARSLIDLDFVEKEDFAELGLNEGQQARLAGLIAKRAASSSSSSSSSSKTAAARLPAPTVMQTLQAASASFGVSESLGAKLPVQQVKPLKLARPQAGTDRTRSNPVTPTFEPAVL